MHIMKSIWSNLEMIHWICALNSWFLLRFALVFVCVLFWNDRIKGDKNLWSSRPGSDTRNCFHPISDSDYFTCDNCIGEWGKHWWYQTSIGKLFLIARSIQAENGGSSSLYIECENLLYCLIWVPKCIRGFFMEFLIIQIFKKLIEIFAIKNKFANNKFACKNWYECW